MENEEQQVETTKIVKGKLVASWKLPTPVWATYVFRFEFWLSKAVLLHLSLSHSIPAEQALYYVSYITGFDGLVWTFAKSIGVQKPEIVEDEKPKEN